MLWNLTLEVEQRPGRFDADCHQQLGGRNPIVVQFARVIRDRGGMQVDDAVDRVVFILQRNPVPECTQIVADMHVTGGLNTREDCLLAHCLLPKKRRGPGAPA